MKDLKKKWFFIVLPVALLLVLVTVSGKALRVEFFPATAQRTFSEVPVRNPAYSLFVAMEEGASPEQIIEMIEASPELTIETRSVAGTSIVFAAYAEGRTDIVQALIQRYGLEYLSERELERLEYAMESRHGISIHEFVEP